LERIRRDRCFFFFAGGVAGADKEPGQQKRNAEHGAAGVGGQSARTSRVKQLVEPGQQWLSPHGGIFCGGKWVEQNGVRFGPIRSGRLLDERWKVPEVRRPFDVSGSGLKRGCAGSDQLAKRVFIPGQIAEGDGVLQGEAEWFSGFIKAENPQMCRDIMHRAQDGNRIGGSAEADVPNDELAAMIFQSLADFELPNVKSLRFGLGTDDRMKRLSMRQRMDAVRAACELDDSITGLMRHEGKLAGVRRTRQVEVVSDQ